MTKAGSGPWSQAVLSIAWFVADLFPKLHGRQLVSSILFQMLVHVHLLVFIMVNAMFDFDRRLNQTA